MKSLFLYPVVLFVLIGSAITNAADDPLFYCLTNAGKKLQILVDGEELIYQYGSDLNAPELELRRPRSEVAVRNTLRPGPILTRSLAFVNGNYRYEVEVHAVRIPFENYHDEGGVEVYEGAMGLGGPHCTKDLRQQVLMVEGLPPIEFPIFD